MLFLRKGNFFVNSQDFRIFWQAGNFAHQRSSKKPSAFFSDAISSCPKRTLSLVWRSGIITIAHCVIELSSIWKKNLNMHTVYSSGLYIWTRVNHLIVLLFLLVFSRLFISLKNLTRSPILKKPTLVDVGNGNPLIVSHFGDLWEITIVKSTTTSKVSIMKKKLSVFFRRTGCK